MRVGAVQTVLDALKRSRQCRTDVVGPTTEVSSHEAEIGYQQPLSQARRAVRTGTAQGTGQFGDACEQEIDLCVDDLSRQFPTGRLNVQALEQRRKIIGRERAIRHLWDHTRNEPG